MSAAKTKTNQAPATPPPPLPPTAAHAEPAPEASEPVEATAPVHTVDGVEYELHPVGTAQYIAELEVENEDALKMKAAVAGRAHEGFKRVATEAITHAAAMQGYGGLMAGHLPQDINAIPGTDAINAAGGAPVGKVPYSSKHVRQDTSLTNRLGRVLSFAFPTFQEGTMATTAVQDTLIADMRNAESMDFDGPPLDWNIITPHDTNDQPGMPCRFLRANAAGDIAVTTPKSGSASRILKFNAGETRQGVFLRVRATGTTATVIEGGS